MSNINIGNLCDDVIVLITLFVESSIHLRFELCWTHLFDLSVTRITNFYYPLVATTSNYSTFD